MKPTRLRKFAGDLPQQALDSHCSMEWKAAANASFDRDLELSVIDYNGRHALAFTCGRIPDAACLARPVNTADMRAGESCWVAYDRKRYGERQNASIVTLYNAWYADVRGSYSGKAD